MSAHTPGPWEAVGSEVRTKRTDVDLRGWGIATLQFSSEPDRREANARLIAAAPEMFEALLDVLDDLERRYDGAPDSSTKWMIRPIQAIEAVIAKAEGKR